MENGEARVCTGPPLLDALRLKANPEMAQFHSWLIDRKIRAVNVSLDIALGDYWNLASDVLKKNDLQRRKVSSAGKVYQLLRRDILEGCVMPPIILAVSERRSDEIRTDIVAWVVARSKGFP